MLCPKYEGMPSRARRRRWTITKLNPKSISLHWEFMFTRARYETTDMGEQGRLLNEVAALRQAWPERMVPNLRRRLSWHAS